MTHRLVRSEICIRDSTHTDTHTQPHTHTHPHPHTQTQTQAQTQTHCVCFCACVCVCFVCAFVRACVCVVVVFWLFSVCFVCCGCFLCGAGGGVSKPPPILFVVCLAGSGVLLGGFGVSGGVVLFSLCFVCFSLRVLL